MVAGETEQRVPVNAVLGCLREVLERHSSNRNEQVEPSLVAIALDERQRFTPLLEETLRASDGLLVDAASCGSGVALDMDDLRDLDKLREAVDATIDAFNILDADASLTLRVEGSALTIAGGSAFEAANSAQRAFRELLCSLFHPDLRGSPLAALVWDDDGFDERSRILIWPLLMRLPGLLGRPAGSTLLLVAGDATINFDLHCRGWPSLEYRVSSSGFERRRRLAANAQAIRETSRQVRQEAPLVVLFLGAGSSAVDGLPTGNELRNRALGEQVGYAVDRGNFDLAARQFYRELKSTETRLKPGELLAGDDVFVSSLTLERVLLEEQAQEHRPDCLTLRRFSRDHADIVTALREARDAGEYRDDPLVRLLAMRRRLVLLTVNFDQVLEAKAGDNVRPYISEGDMATLVDDLKEYRKSGGRVPLVKLHGDIGVPTSIVANVEETAGGLSDARLAALDSVIGAMKEQAVRPWWYVGYSMRDLDLAAHWQSASFADDMVEHWVAPFIDSSVRNFIGTYRQSRWDRHSYRYGVEDRAVTLTASDFFSLLWEQVSKTW